MIKKLRVTVDGRPYDVTVEVPEESEILAAPTAPVHSAPVAPPPVIPPSPATVPPPSSPTPAPATPAATGGASAGDVPSPLAGRVIAIVVKPGQEVKENEHLLTLEAMKMNTFVSAPKAGKVAQIKVAVGDAVNEGQALVQIA